MAFFEWLSFGCWLHFTHSTCSVTHILAVCVCVCVCVDVCLGGGWLCVYDVCAMGGGAAEGQKVVILHQQSYGTVVYVFFTTDWLLYRALM